MNTTNVYDLKFKIKGSDYLNLEYMSYHDGRDRISVFELGYIITRPSFYHNFVSIMLVYDDGIKRHSCKFFTAIFQTYLFIRTYRPTSLQFNSRYGL